MKIFTKNLKPQGFLLKVFILLCMYGKAGAQDVIFPCANEKTESFLLQNPVYKAEFDAINQAIANGYLHKTATGNTILEIPLAVHVIHTGEAYGTGSNIPDDQVIDAVKGANERWRHIIGNSVDMEVQFCLAQTDPDGNPSNGIDHVDGSSVQYYKDYGISYISAAGDTAADELTIKNLRNWPHNYVFNIWVVNKIAGGWGGYAFFPLSTNYPTDGVTIIYTAMKYSSTTLAHELGHGMGLFHTFNGDFNNQCPGNSVCTLLGDQVCDTPPHRQPDCGSTPCSNAPDSLLNNTFKNYMSYCGGRDLFTQGQKDRSRSVIQTTVRRYLLKSTACNVSCDTAYTYSNTTTCDPSIAGIHYDTLRTVSGCDSIIVTTTALTVPVVQANFSFTSGSGTTINFDNLSENADSYQWNFGDDSTSTEEEPVHTYLTTGTFNVELIATNNCGSDTANATVTLIATGIRNNLQSILLYPNPNKGSFALEMDVPANTVATLVNEAGQVVVQQTLSAGKHHSISFGKLAKGNYRLQILHNEKTLGSTPVIIN